MCRDRLPASWPDLAEKLADFEVKCGLMDFLRGRQGLGSNWVDPYRCQDAFPGLVGPYRATGGQFGAIFHISRISNIFPDDFSYFPIIPRCGWPILYPINKFITGVTTEKVFLGTALA